MIDTIIVSGGNIHSDFALDFLQKNKKENKRNKCAQSKIAAVLPLFL